MGMNCRSILGPPQDCLWLVGVGIRRLLIREAIEEKEKKGGKEKNEERKDEGRSGDVLVDSWSSKGCSNTLKWLERKVFPLA